MKISPICLLVLVLFLGNQTADIFSAERLQEHMLEERQRAHAGSSLLKVGGMIACGALVTFNEVLQGSQKIWFGMSINPYHCKPLFVFDGIKQLAKSPYVGTLAAMRGPRLLIVADFSENLKFNYTNFR